MKGKDKTKEQLIEELEKLRQELHLYETIIEKMPVALTVWKLEDLDDPGSFRLIACNPQIEKATGAPYREFVGTTVWETFPSSLETEGPYIYAEAVRTGQVRDLPDLHFPGDEQTAAGIYSVTVVPLGGRIAAIFCENITERVWAEERLEHLNLVLRAIRRVNQLIARESDRDRLLQGGCDRLIETRGYYNTWIALLDETGGLVTTAEAGLGEAFLPMVEQLKRGELTACGARALLQPDVVATEDPPSACADCPLSASYRDRGAMTVRLEHGGKVYGLLSASIPAHLTAGQEEQALFEEASRDIAFALHGIELEEQRKWAEEALRASETEKRAILDAMSDIVLFQDTNLSIRWGNEAARRSVGKTQQELVGCYCYELWHGRSEPCERCPVLRALETGSHADSIMMTPDGRWWEITGEPVRDRDGKIVGAIEIAHDITERKRADEELRTQRDKFEGIIASLTDGLDIVSPDYRVHFQNKMLRDRFGDLTGKLCYEEYMAREIPCEPCPMVKAIATGSTQRVELIGADGREYEVTSTPFQDIDGETKAIEVVRDITERKEAEEALRESEERFRTIIEDTDAGYFRVDRDGRWQHVNEAWLRMHGYDSPGEVIGKHFALTQVEADLEQAKRVVESLLSGAPIPTGEFSRRYKDGSIGYHTFSANPVVQGGEVVGLEGFIIDVTKRKRAEEALRESEELYSNIVESMSDGIMALDRDFHYTHWNHAMEMISKVPREELVGTAKCPWDIFPHLVEQGVDEMMRRAMHGEVVEREAIPYRLPNGTRGFTSETFLPLETATGEIRGIVGVIREITERKRAEEELQQSFKKLRRTLEGTVNTLVSAIEMRDPYTAGHQRRVTQLACAIAKEMGLSEERIEGTRMAGLIHDIGKINVPAEILSKPGPLSDLEYGLIQAHPQVGHDVLNGAIEFPWPVAEIVLQHHERMDGSGYPQGLSGEEIILEARILGVADVVEAMASHRPYRSARSIDEALEEISQNRGVLYDPEVVDACLKLFTEKGFTFEQGEEMER